MSFKTPILIIGFNRPEKIRSLLSVVKEIEPENLFVCIDGPRNENDSEKISKINNILDEFNSIIKSKKIREKNLGCKLGMVGAITWFFEQNEKGIILEDDCIPDKTFFEYCDSLLTKYSNEKSIMHISGHQKIIDLESNETYYFSKIANVWGWATWKDRWEKFDIEMKDLNKNKKIIFNSFKKNTYGKYWYKLFLHMKKNNVDAWAARWQYTVLINQGISIAPTKNFIKNIGFDEEATHTKSTSLKLNDRTNTVSDIVHPTNQKINSNFDEIEMKQRIIPLYKKLLLKIFKK